MKENHDKQPKKSKRLTQPRKAKVKPPRPNKCLRQPLTRFVRKRWIKRIEGGVTNKKSQKLAFQPLVVMPNPLLVQNKKIWAKSPITIATKRAISPRIIASQKGKYLSNLYVNDGLLEGLTIYILHLVSGIILRKQGQYLDWFQQQVQRDDPYQYS